MIKICGITYKYLDDLVREAIGRMLILLNGICLKSVKPLDTETIIACAKQTGAVVTAEEHQIYGGMGSAVAECLVQNVPVPMCMVGVKDTFGKSGQPQELMDQYGLSANSIYAAVVNAKNKKR